MKNGSDVNRVKMISNQQPYNNHQHQPGPPNNSTSNMSPHQPSPRSAHHLRHLTSSHGNGSPGSRHNGRRVHDSRSAFFFALVWTKEISGKFERNSEDLDRFCCVLPDSKQALSWDRGVFLLILFIKLQLLSDSNYSIELIC